MKSLKIISGFFVFVALGISVWFHLATETLPFSFVKSYLIQVKDKDTGKPIPGVIAHATWSESVLSLEAETPNYEEHYIMSDENGYVRIPWKFGIHPYSYFASMNVSFCHPYYYSGTGKGIGYFSNADLRKYSPGQEYNERMKQKPVVEEFQSFKSYFKNAHCTGTKSSDGVNFEKVCTGNGEQATSIIHTVDDYIEMVKTQSIRGKKMELLISPNEISDNLKPLALSIYSGSPQLPVWISHFDELNK